MDKFPGMKDMGEHIRTSMNKVLEVALTVGGVVAAEAMAGKFVGSCWIWCFICSRLLTIEPYLQEANC